MTGKSSDSPACSVVIRAFNEEEHIGRLLEGILKQTFLDPEIILVDSGSTDATVAIALRYPVKVVHIRPEDFTFGHSLNRGIATSSGEFLVVASAHVYPVYPDWLERLLKPFEDGQVAVVYGKQRGGATTRFSEIQVFARWYPEISQSRQGHPFCNNANAALRRELWEQHAFDETLSGLEDVAWARWAMEQGYQVTYSAEAEVIHVHDETLAGIYNRYRRESMAFKRIFPGESFHWWDFLRLFTGNVGMDLWHAARQGSVLAELRGILSFRFMQFWGTYQGFRHSGPLTWQLRQTFYYPRGVHSKASAEPREVNPIQYNDAAQP